MPQYSRYRSPAVTMCIGSVLALTTTAGAQNAEFSLSEADFYEPLPRVLTASRLVQPLTDAPAAMTIIDRDMIEASSAIDIPGLLRLVPGFQVTYTEGIDAVSTYQGFADHFPKRMQVLVDGRSVYDPGINGVLWSALPLNLNQIERIEVVRGANAAVYGSNAFLGTINIITRRPESMERFSGRVMSGSANTGEGEIALADQIGDFAYALDASYSANDGFRNKPDDNQSRLFNFSGVYHVSTRDNIRFYTGIRDTEFESTAFRIRRDRDYTSSYQQLVWNHLISNEQDVRVQAFHNAFESPDDNTLVAPGLGIPVHVDYSLTTHRYDLEMQHRFRPAQDWRVSWGGGLRRDTVRGKGLFDAPNDIDRDVFRLFGNVEWQPLDGVAVNAGVMHEHFSDLGDHLSPRLAVNWEFIPHHTVRVSAARAYRMPTTIERHGEVKIDIPATPASPDSIELLGTSDNKAEQIDTYEIGYLIDMPSVRGIVDLRLFRHDLHHLLYEIADGTLPGTPLRYDDAGSIQTTGFELQTQLRPGADWLFHLAYSYAQTDGSYITRYDARGQVRPTRMGNPRPADPSVPDHTFTVLVSKKLDNGWQLSGTYYHVSPMEWLGEGDNVGEQNRLDAKLIKRLRHGASDIELSLNVQNLLDDHYWEFNPPNEAQGISGNLAERRIYAQVKVILQ